MNGPYTKTTVKRFSSPMAASVKKILFVYFIAFLVASISCAPVSQRISFKEIKWEEVDANKTPTQADYPNANAIFLSEEGEFSVTKQCIFTHHVIIKILNEAGLEYANVEIPFFSEDEVHNIRGRTIRKDNTVVELQPKDIHEKTLFPEYVLYSDSKAKVFAMPGAEVGSIIEYSYSMLYKAPFASAWEFQRNVPVLVSSITLNIPDFLGYNYLLITGKGVEVEKSISHPAGRTKAVFRLRNAPSISYEPFMLPLSMVGTQVCFSLASLSMFGINLPIEGDSWEILGDNYWYPVKDSIITDKAIKSQVREIISGSQTEREKIERIYDFVQSKIRYVAIEIKEGRVVPHGPPEVFTNKYGDCKDKAFLFLTMLKEAGIEAFPVLTRTRESGIVIENFISAQQFNHMVVSVPAQYFTDMKGYEDVVIKGDKEYTVSDDYILLDVTSRAIPFAQIPWYLDNTKALLIKEGESKLINIPSSSMQANKTIQECEVEIQEDGTVFCSAKSTKTGQEANAARSLLQPLNETEQKEWFERSVNRVCPGAILKNHSISQLFELNQSLVLSYEFRIPQYAQQIDTFLVFSPSILRNPMFDELTRETRKHAISFDYCKTLIDAIKIKIPGNLKIKTLPDTLFQSSDLGDYSFSCLTDGEKIVLNKQLSIKRTQIELEKYEQVRSFFERILISERKNATLCRK